MEFKLSNFAWNNKFEFPGLDSYLRLLNTECASQSFFTVNRKSFCRSRFFVVLHTSRFKSRLRFWKVYSSWVFDGNVSSHILNRKRMPMPKKKVLSPFRSHYKQNRYSIENCAYVQVNFRLNSQSNHKCVNMTFDTSRYVLSWNKRFFKWFFCSFCYFAISISIWIRITICNGT